jgi:hypothetical protein
MPFLKGYSVLHVGQMDDLPAPYDATPAPKPARGFVKKNHKNLLRGSVRTAIMPQAHFASVTLTHRIHRDA